MLILSVIISVSAALYEFFTTERLVVMIPYGFIVPILLILPRLFYKFNSQLKNQVTKDWLKYVELICFFIVALNAPGSLWLHKMGFQYDRFLHFFIAFFSLMILFLFLLPYRGDLKGKNNIIIITVFVLGVFVFLWEYLQYFIDESFGTKLFFDVNQTEKMDFIEDVIFGFLGLCAGAASLHYSFKKFLSVLKI